MSIKERIEKLSELLNNISTKENNTIYFLVYDTKNNARASVKHIYDIALTLKKNGFNSKMLVEDKTYSGVSEWLSNSENDTHRYSDIEICHIRDEEKKLEIRIEDIIVIPEYYSNILESLTNIKAMKVLLVQQKEYIFETLPIGSRWSDFGVNRVITTTESTKNYIKEIFPEVLTHIIPPIIGDNFYPSTKQEKPIMAIFCKDRSINRKIISEFYIRYPHLRWFTFKDMFNMSYNEFSENLRECMVSVWVDDDSTFGTFPLESMKTNVPVIGKIPKNEPDWISENGMWTYDENKIVDILGTYVMAWLDSIELQDEVKQKMKDTLLPYDKELTENNIITVFNSFYNTRIESIKNAIEKLKEQEDGK